MVETIKYGSLIPNKNNLARFAFPTLCAFAGTAILHYISVIH
jgi:hypothetical protein